MRKCSICNQSGHNKRTCQSNEVCPVIPKKKEEINLEKTQFEFEKYNDMLQEMKIKRENQYDLANDCVQSLMDGKNVSIKAEEKTGKRIIMECIHLILNINHKSSIVSLPRSVYITALNRKDTKPQFEEQESFGITSIVAGKSNELLGEIVKIMNDESGDSIVYIHLDECDYGTGNTQALSKLYLSPELKTHRTRIKFITYSATPQEVTLCEQINEPQWSFLEFIPHESYFGAQKYLDNDLVFEPETFYDGDNFTDHGKKIVRDMKEYLSGCGNKRNIAVVRDTTPGMLKSIKSKIESLETQYECIVKVYDQVEPFEWGNPESWSELGRIQILNDDLEHLGYNYIPVIIFISQICTRSTEICPLGHRRLYAWHDVRTLSDKRAYNTLSQAIGRVKHYTQSGHPENLIKLYCDIDILNITVGKELENTEKPDLIIAQRVARKRYKNNSKFKCDRFLDGYKTIHDVPLSEWSSDIPLNSSDRKKVDKTTYKSVDGKWCHYDGKPRYFGNDISLGNTDHEQVKNVLQYESETSDRYIIRKAMFVKNEYNTTEETDEFITTPKSMYYYY